MGGTAPFRLVSERVDELHKLVFGVSIATFFQRQNADGILCVEKGWDLFPIAFIRIETSRIFLCLFLEAAFLSQEL